MAKAIKKTQSKSFHSSPFSIYWNRKNYFVFGIGIALIILGFYFLSLGNWDSTPSLYWAPILLFIAYVIILPLSIFVKDKSNTNQKSE